MKDIGFDDVKWGSFKDVPQNFASLCDFVLVSTSWSFENNSILNIKLGFISCVRDVFLFESRSDMREIRKLDIQTAFHNKCMEMYGYKKSYVSTQRLSLPSKLTRWNEKSLKEHFNEHGADRIEGIYESIKESSTIAKYKLGLIKSDSGYNLIYISGAINHLDWKEGEIKAKLRLTATPDLYKAYWEMSNKTVNENTYISFESGMLSLIQNNDKIFYIKLYPAINDGVKITNAAPASGTGFGISSNGLIATNSHVINGTSTIQVRGIKGDFSKALSAKVILDDKNNDLAIIQINDPTFTTLGVIPYTISNKSSDVGTSVFVLGYPLKALMGDEIKLTNGIISSKSGYQGDVTSYQISAPLQPGNSGGPMFDEKGNLIGIVNAKLTIGENVSYAIKSSYLLNLIDLLPAKPIFLATTSLIGKPLTDQVKLINSFVYTIEINSKE